MRHLKKVLQSLLAISILFSMQARAQIEELSLMLDWFINPIHAPIIIAQQKGYFNELGLVVNIKEPSDPTIPPKLVAAGKFDMAVTYMPNMIMDIDQGLPLVRSGSLIGSPLNTLIVNKNIKSLKDLKGKKIGISVSGNEEAFIGAMLKTAGLSFKDITIVNVGWNLSSSLGSNQVDAIWGGFRNFEINQLNLENIEFNVFYPEENAVPTYDELVFVVNKNLFVKSKITKFNKALEKATMFIINHPKQAWEIFKKSNPKMLDNKLNELAFDATLTRYSTSPSALDLNRYKTFAEFLYQNQIITKMPSDKAYFLEDL